MNNIHGLRILGWKLKLGSRAKIEYMIKFCDVLEFDPQLPKRTLQLYIPKKETTTCPDCKKGFKMVECSCKGMIGSSCSYCNGDWKQLKVTCPTCKGTRKAELLEEDHN
jgi:hypothetical protein